MKRLFTANVFSFISKSYHPERYHHNVHRGHIFSVTVSKEFPPLIKNFNSICIHDPMSHEMYLVSAFEGNVNGKKLALRQTLASNGSKLRNK